MLGAGAGVVNVEAKLVGRCAKVRVSPMVFLGRGLQQPAKKAPMKSARSSGSVVPSLLKSLGMGRPSQKRRTSPWQRVIRVERCGENGSELAGLKTDAGGGVVWSAVRKGGCGCRVWGEGRRRWVAGSCPAFADGVGITGHAHGGVVGDLAALVEVEEGVINGDHAVLAAGLNLGQQLMDFVFADVVANGGGADEDFAAEDAAFFSGAGEELLGDNALERAGEHEADFVLSAFGERADHSVEDIDGAGCVERGEDEVTGLGGHQGGVDGFGVAHFTDTDDVGVLPEDVAEGGVEILYVDEDFLLDDDRAFEGVDVLDWVFDGDDLGGLLGVDEVEEVVEGCCLTDAGGAGEDNEAAGFARERLDDLGEAEFFAGAD